MPRAAFRLCACGLLATAALAQPAPSDPAIILGQLQKQTAPLALAWLHDPDPRFQLWGAYLILRDWRREAIPDLLDLLAAAPIVEEPVTAGDRGRHSALVAVLDALIQFEAPVPVEQAQRLYPEFPVQSLILLSRFGEDTTPVLMDIFKTEQRYPAAWLAAGNLLAQNSAEGFFAAVLGSMTVHAQVLLTDPNAGEGGSFGGGNLCCMTGTPPHFRADFPSPAIGFYAFAACADRLEREITLLAAGTDPSYYRRIVTNTYYEGVGGACCKPDQDLVRQHYLSKVLFDSPDRPSLPAHVSRTIAWQSPEAYLRDLAAFIAEQQIRFTYVAQKLRESNRLSESEAATLRPRLQITIQDQRTTRDTTLPALAPLPENVTVEP